MYTIEQLQIRLHMLIDQQLKAKKPEHIVKLSHWVWKVECEIALRLEKEKQKGQCYAV